MCIMDTMGGMLGVYNGHHGGYSLPCYMGTMVGIVLPAICPGVPWWIYTTLLYARVWNPGYTTIPPTVPGVPTSARPAPRCVAKRALGSVREESPG